MGRTVTDPREAAAELAERFGRASSAVFFGGAGVSTASGIPDFRSADLVCACDIAAAFGF